MNEMQHRLKKASRLTALYLCVGAIAAVILTPVLFLLSLSCMSDAEAYNEWPLPFLPSTRTHFLVEPASPDATQPGYTLHIYSPARNAYRPLVEGNDPWELAAILDRTANCSVDGERLEREMQLAVSLSAGRFTLRKNLFANYQTFFRVTTDAFPALLRSLWTALATVAISLGVGGTAGYAFARYHFKGKRLLRTSVLFVRIFPGIAVAIPMVVILARMGMLDRPLGLAIVYAVGNIALAVWITAGVFAGIPVQLEEAARVFGAGRMRAFFHVTLPLALPGLAACAMFAFLGAWNETVQAIVLTQANPTFPVVVYQSLVGSRGMIHLVAAGGVTMAVPALFFTLLIRKYIVGMWGMMRL